MQWLPLLQATVAGVRMHEEREATMALQLLTTVAETGGESVAPHVPAMTAVVQVETCKRIPHHPEPWPQVRKKFLAVQFVMYHVNYAFMRWTFQT